MPWKSRTTIRGRTHNPSWWLVLFQCMHIEHIEKENPISHWSRAILGLASQAMFSFLVVGWGPTRMSRRMPGKKSRMKSLTRGIWGRASWKLHGRLWIITSWTSFRPVQSWNLTTSPSEYYSKNNGEIQLTSICTVVNMRKPGAILLMFLQRMLEVENHRIQCGVEQNSRCQSARYFE